MCLKWLGIKCYCYNLKMSNFQALLSNGINSKGLETLQYQKYTLLESCSGELSVMQVRLTAMKSQKVQELAKKENPNIFKEQFQIATPQPHNTQNGVL